MAIYFIITECKDKETGIVIESTFRVKARGSNDACTKTWKFMCKHHFDTLVSVNTSTSCKRGNVNHYPLVRINRQYIMTGNPLTYTL